MLLPLGSALAGPLADAFGTTTTLWGAVVLDVTCLAAILMLPSVWAIRASGAPAPART